MNKRLKKLVEQAGFEFDAEMCEGWIADNEHIERFAELVRQNEREACAKLCESMGVHPALNVWGGGPEWYKRQKECATAIRARGNHEQD